jgi:hypothetical protein
VVAPVDPSVGEQGIVVVVGVCDEPVARHQGEHDETREVDPEPDEEPPGA